MNSLLSAKSCPKDKPERDGKPAAEQTRKKWTGYFVPLHLALECETKTLTGQGDTFGTAAAISAIYGINPSYLAGAATVMGRVGPAMTIIEELDGHFESLAFVATNIN